MQAATETQIRASAEYQRLDRDAQAAEQRVAGQVRQIDQELNQVLTPQILSLNEAFQVLRSEIGALTYELETTNSESEKRSLREDIDEIKKRTVTVSLPQADGSTRKVRYGYGQMERDLATWRTRKASLQQQRVDLLKPATQIRAQRDKYLADRIAEVSTDTIAGIRRSLDDFDVEIRQIHIKDVDLVDR